MRISSSLALGLWVFTAAGALHAQDTAQVKRLELTGDLGFVNTSGNSSVTTVNIGDKLVFRSRDARHVLTQLFALVYGRSEGETVADNWRASGRYEYGLKSRLFLFALLGVDRDRLAGMDRRFEEGVGLTWKAVAAGRDELTLEAGLSLIQERATAAASESFLAGRSSARFIHRFRETVSFAQSLEFLPNLEASEDYRLNSEAAFVAAISRNFAFKTSYVIRYDHAPEVGFTSTDRLLTTGLQISY